MGALMPVTPSSVLPDGSSPPDGNRLCPQPQGQTDQDLPGWSNGPARSACGRSGPGSRRAPHRIPCSGPPSPTCAQTADGMDGLRRNVGPHRSPQVHLLVDSIAATGWQAHSVRGFISAQIGKRMGLVVRSFKRDGMRVYQILSLHQGRPSEPKNTPDRAVKNKLRRRQI